MTLISTLDISNDYVSILFHQLSRVYHTNKNVLVKNVQNVLHKDIRSRKKVSGI